MNEDSMLFPPLEPTQVRAGGALTPYIEVKDHFRGESVDTVVSSCYGNVEGEASGSTYSLLLMAFDPLSDRRGVGSRPAPLRPPSS
jgi:hypothetical protein